LYSHRPAFSAEAAAAAVPQYQTSDGKPYALVPPHPPSSTTSASLAGPEGKPLDSRRSSMQKEELVVMENSADRRSTVFATLRSAHNPLESSTSNPAIFSYAPEDFADDNRNTDPYGFEGHYQSRKKRIVYEVVV
uniref:AGC-kinase C-terminal domain-containing protein n=1 Tax=Macrostomum lignano TaxID=282301 RepID=A0A1I8GNV9_9PLAT